MHYISIIRDAWYPFRLWTYILTYTPPNPSIVFPGTKRGIQVTRSWLGNGSCSRYSIRFCNDCPHSQLPDSEKGKETTEEGESSFPAATAGYQRAYVPSGLLTLLLLAWVVNHRHLHALPFRIITFLKLASHLIQYTKTLVHKSFFLVYSADEKCKNFPFLYIIYIYIFIQEICTNIG